MRHNPLGCTYSYLLLDSAALIDTGVGTSQAREALKNQIETAGVNPSEIKHVILTHLHGDHVGLVDFVRSISAARVYAHFSVKDMQNEMAESWKGLFKEAQNELKMLGGAGYLSLFGRFERFLRRPRPFTEIDEALDDAEDIMLDGSSLKVFWTPGHAPEHICLYDEERRILYSGDHVLPRITSHISLHTFQRRDPLREYLDSLDRLKGLPVDAVLPAHEHIFHDLDGRIQELKLHHASRCDEIKGSIRNREKTVFQISEEVSWDTKPWSQMDFWSKRMAAAETLAHLVYLRNKGEVEEKLKDGILYYGLI